MQAHPDYIDPHEPYASWPWDCESHDYSHDANRKHHLLCDFCDRRIASSTESNGAAECETTANALESVREGSGTVAAGATEGGTISTGMHFRCGEGNLYPRQQRQRRSPLQVPMLMVPGRATPQHLKEVSRLEGRQVDQNRIGWEN